MLNSGDWQIEIQNRPGQFLTDIWIFRRGTDNKVCLWYDEFNQREYPTQEARLPATLVIPTDLVPVLLATITSKGYKPPAESFVAGKLEATEEHLADLRRLLKLDTIICQEAPRQ